MNQNYPYGLPKFTHKQTAWSASWPAGARPLINDPYRSTSAACSVEVSNLFQIESTFYPKCCIKLLPYDLSIISLKEPIFVSIQCLYVVAEVPLIWAGIEAAR